MLTDAKSILEHALVLGLRVMNSSFLLLYFFNLLLSFSLSFFFLLPFLSPSLFIFLRIIYYGFLHHFLHPRVGQVLGVIFLCFPCLFLNLPFLTIRLLVHCSGVTSTLMRQES